MELTDFSISALDRGLRKRRPWYERHALALIALAFSAVWLVSSFEPAAAKEEAPRCMSNKECCARLDDFINGHESRFVEFCRQYEG